MATKQELDVAARKAGHEIRLMRSNMPSFVELVVFLILTAISLGIAALVGQYSPGWGILLGVLGIIASALAASAIKVANQWERGLVLRLGEFHSIRGPGLFFVVPIVDRVRMVDTRVLAVDIPRQEVITRDNVPVSINGVLYFKVAEAKTAVIDVQDFTYAISQYAQAALRDVVGGLSLDDLLAERQKIGDQIEEIIQKQARAWGLEVSAIKMQDVDMPEDLKKMMSRQASAEREKRATITKAEGDKLAAVNLAEAARTMTLAPGAMQLRTLQTLDGLGPTASNTVVMALPVDVLEAFQTIAGKIGGKKAA
jgi:regulator of protease activity HflC (stomatin/prohibitin superfamily)